MPSPRPQDVRQANEEWRQVLCEALDELLAALKHHRRGDLLAARAGVVAGELALERLRDMPPGGF